MKNLSAIQKECNRLYEVYLKPGADKELNVPIEILRPVRQKFEKVCVLARQSHLYIPVLLGLTTQQSVFARGRRSASTTATRRCRGARS